MCKLMHLYDVYGMKRSAKLHYFLEEFTKMLVTEGYRCWQRVDYQNNGRKPLTSTLAKHLVYLNCFPFDFRI